MVQAKIDVEPGYRGPFLERGGESTRVLAEELCRPPEAYLSDADKAEAYEFEATLFSHEIIPGMTIPDILKDHKPEALTAPLVFADAFVQADMHSVLQQLEIKNCALPEFSDNRQVFLWFAEAVRDKIVDTKDLAKLSKYSIDYYTDRMASSLFDGCDVTEEFLEFEHIVFDPGREIRLAHQAREARKKLLDLRKIYKRGGFPLDGAKRAFIDIYLGKINSEIAEDVSKMEYVVRQAQILGDEELAASAKDAMPTGFQNVADHGQLPASLMRRLDYLKNGMGEAASGRSTPLSEKLFNVRETGEDEGEVEPIFSEEEKRRLQQVLLSPDQMVEVFTAILKKAELLSAEDASTWTPTRRGRAHDDLIQVVKHPNKNTYTVDTVSGTLQTPNGSRSIYDTLVVGTHELFHISQLRADDALGQRIKIAKQKGRRVSMLKEAGANVKQRAAEKAWFGVSKPIGALTYAKGMEALNAGGNLADAARAFYQEKHKNFPDGNDMQAAREAADRVLRLMRSSGYNSQPLSYAEEKIMLDELAGASPAAQDRAAAVTSFDLVDQARLHKYGLLPELHSEHVDWNDLIFEELAPYIDAALADNQVTVES